MFDESTEGEVCFAAVASGQFERGAAPLSFRGAPWMWIELKGA